jgi:2-keto-4-pentenoate hydratase
MNANENRVKTAAQYLFDSARNRENHTGLPDDLMPPDLQSALQVQDELQSLWQQAGAGGCAGWKVALTSKVMQEFVGYGQPCAGMIFESRVLRSPARIRAADYVHPGGESEIAVRLGRDLPAGGEPHTRESVAEAVAAVMPAIELVEDRAAVYEGLNPMLLIADNAWNAACILGPETTDFQNLDLATVSGRASINGAEIGRGVGGDALGHPFEPLAWLANGLNARGNMLHAGEIVMTGSMVATHWLNAGEELLFEIDALGEVRLSVD